jgi:hypothetical protein
MNGKEKMSGKTSNGERIDVSGFSKGNYLIKVANSNAAGFISFQKN